MIKYYGMLYAKIGRKYIPTGRTAADWDLMESAINPQSSIVCRLENGHLIAAAPDLLAALKLALPCVEYAEIETASKGQNEAHDKCLSALEWIREAIAKAEGNA